MSTLREIFDRHGSDKGCHGYAAFYETLPEPVSMLEIGVWKGASLSAWREWWPKPIIIGLDDEARGHVQVLGCATLKGDSRTWRPNWPSGLFGLIIDDGSHKPRDQAATFRNLWPLVAPGGVYAIEDVVIYDRPLPQWFADRAEHFNVEAGCDLLDAIKDAKAVFEPHDYRHQSGKPDSVLFVIRKPV